MRSDGTVGGRFGRLVVLALPAMAAVLVLALAATLADFSYTHAWASAHFATIARSFAQHGIFALHGIPIENNDPITVEPDTYLHFPPLYYYVLSVVIAGFPGSIRALHLFMAAVVIASAWAIWRIAARLFAPKTAALCAGAFLLMPATLRYGLALLMVNFAILETLIALLLAMRYVKAVEGGRHAKGQLCLAALFYCLACFTSWEPYLIAPGLLVVFAVDRARVVWDVLLAFGIAAAAALAALLALYATSDSNFLADLWSIFAFRTGLAPYLPLSARIHPVDGWRGVAHAESIGWRTLVQSYIVRSGAFVGALGVLGVCALLVPALRARLHAAGRAANIVVVPCAALWFGWAVLMWQHYTIHEYQMVLATPFLALCIALFYDGLEICRSTLQPGAGRDGMGLVINLGIPAALLLTGFTAAWTTYLGDDDAVREASLGRAIKQTVPAGAIVVTDSLSMVPVYYSERHVLRDMTDGGLLAREMGPIISLCPDCPIYLAISRDKAAKFADAIGKTPPLYRDDRFLITRLK